MSLIRSVPILEERDVVTCRRACRDEAKNLGFNLVDQTKITTAASELARNIYEYARTGEVLLEMVNDTNGKVGLKIVFTDHGPGIEDVSRAMSDGWSSHHGMGMGLPGSRKLMDEFSIESIRGEGTTVTIIKWQR